MAKPDDVTEFKRWLARSTAGIGANYFLLPVADRDGGEPLLTYRERVYAYELYHQLRVRWPRNWVYSIAGEVDKRGHPIVRGADLNRVKPDLLVHVPGDMSANLVVIEIKAAGPAAINLQQEAENIDTDVKKLSAFCARADYEQGILLVFGEGIERIRAHAAVSATAGVDFSHIELWHHPGPNRPARRIDWL